MKTSEQLENKGHETRSVVRSRATSFAVKAIGMVSALGPDAATSCAAARAGISRATPIEAFQLYSEEDWGNVGVIGHAANAVARGFEGFGKLVQLASGALVDLLSSHPIPVDEWPRIAICLAIPSAYFQAELMAAQGMTDGERDRAAEQIGLMLSSLVGRVCQLNSIPVNPSAQFLFAEDQCGFAHGLAKAEELLGAGAFDRCIVGGVDACTEGAAMAAAHHFNVLKAGEQASGYMPGEAAGWVMVESGNAAVGASPGVLAWIDAVAEAFETVDRTSPKPAIGIGLAAAIMQCLAQSPAVAADVGWLIGDLNGDAFRANDWGYALSRLVSDHPWLGRSPLVLPAESFGEVGAAAGPVATCVAVRAFARGYAPAPTALVWLASYRGQRAAFLIRQGS